MYLYIHAWLFTLHTIKIRLLKLLVYQDLLLWTHTLVSQLCVFATYLFLIVMDHVSVMLQKLESRIFTEREIWYKPSHVQELSKQSCRKANKAMAPQPWEPEDRKRGPMRQGPKSTGCDQISRFIICKESEASTMQPQWFTKLATKNSVVWPSHIN